MGHLKELVGNWGVTRQDVDFNGVTNTEGDLTDMVLSVRTLQDAETAKFTVAHELGHAVDAYYGDGWHTDPRLSLDVARNKTTGQRRVRGHGVVAREITDLYRKDPDSVVMQELRYPLDRDAYSDLNTGTVRSELFAQLFAMSLQPDTMAFIKDNMPHTRAFLEELHAQLKHPETIAEIQEYAQDARQAVARADDARGTSGSPSSKRGEGVRHPTRGDELNRQGGNDRSADLGLDTALNTRFSRAHTLTAAKRAQLGETVTRMDEAKGRVGKWFKRAGDAALRTVAFTKDLAFQACPDFKGIKTSSSLIEANAISVSSLP